ncbi:MAG: putative branched-chain amino acid transporter ATP-binding protein [Acidimicrobiales bacterium]|nr:putative branched-chain amino acid transporter ATP-binding protein [Acidimicrobiales bacterium]
MNGDVLLEAKDLSCGYGRMSVVRGLDLPVVAGEVAALIGPNGAGKTTTLLTLAGELAPISGEVRWLGAPTSSPMHQRCKQGLSYVTEERSVIMKLTAHENLRLANVTVAAATALFPELEPLLKRPAGLLSGGEQQMLTVARALGRHPAVMLLDELSLGLAPIIVQRLLQAVRTASKERGVGVLLVEQHVRQALQVADRVYVMQRGRIVLSGSAHEVGSQLSEIEAAYLTAAPEGDQGPA